MKAHYVIHPREGYVESLYEGSVTLSTLGPFIEKIWSDPNWKSDLNGLLDFSAATIDLSDSELKALLKAMQEDPRCSFARWAFVVKTAENFGRLRKVDALAKPESTLRIFFSGTEAKDWLLQPVKNPPIVG